MLDRILLVDDDENFLSACHRRLHGYGDVHTACGGQEALDRMQSEGGFAVIVADMGMPGMTGAELLAEVQRRYPQTVRIMLTGHADVDTAVRGINEAQIFRFLPKPCERQALLDAVHDGCALHQRLMAEQQLLAETLNGSIKLLVDLLSLAAPDAFGRASRVRRIIKHIVNKLALANGWQYEVAGMLSQVGCLTVAPEILEKVRLGSPLTAAEQSGYEGHPEFGGRLVANVPRLEEIAHMISRQNEPYSWDPSTAPIHQQDRVSVGSHILKAALSVDEQICAGRSIGQILRHIRSMDGVYDEVLLNALEDFTAQDNAASRQLGADDLELGMILAQDVRAKDDTLIASRGQEVSMVLMEQLRRWNHGIGLQEPLAVLSLNNVEASTAQKVSRIAV